MKFNLEFSTPEKIIYKKTIKALYVKGVEGDLGILPKHERLVCILKDEIVKITTDQGIYEVFAINAILQVTPQACFIVAEYAYPIEELTEEIIVRHVEHSNILRKRR